jgi:hypothetical protein
VSLVWRALAWYEDWFPIGTVHSSITVSSTLKPLLEFRDLDIQMSHVPSGLIPDCHPSGGARAEICASVGVVALPDDNVADVTFVMDEGEGDAGEDV